MIVVDTSVWIDHMRATVPQVTELVLERRLLQHPFVTGELAVGTLPNRPRTIRALRGLPPIEPVADDEFHDFMDQSGLHGTGLGFVDIHLLAATARAGAKLWTRDRRFRDQAVRLGLAYES